MIKKNTRQNEQEYKDKKKHIQFLDKKGVFFKITTSVNGNCL